LNFDEYPKEKPEMKKNSRVSPEARARISAAQRERWKKHRESKDAVVTVATMTEAPPSIYLDELNQEVIKIERRLRFDSEFIHNLLRDALPLMKGGNPSAWTLVEAALKHVQSTTTKVGA
jgi:hypothetical protein